jgi:hypothetical protein
MSVGAEQRRHARVFAQVPLTVSADRGVGIPHRIVVGRLLDASPGGLAFAPDDPAAAAIAAGDRVELSVSEPRGRTCLAPARATIVATTNGSQGRLVAHCALDPDVTRGTAWLDAVRGVARRSVRSRAFQRLAPDAREAMLAWQRVDPVGLAYWFWESVPARDVVAGRSAGLDDLQWLVWPSLQAEPLKLGELLAGGESDVVNAALERARIGGDWIEDLARSMSLQEARMAAAQKLARDQPTVIADLFAWLLEPERDESAFKEEVGTAGTMFYLPAGIHPDAYESFYAALLEREDWRAADDARRAAVREQAIWSALPDLAPRRPRDAPSGPPLFLTETSLGYLLHLIEVLLGAPAMMHAKQRIAALYGYD